MNVLNAELRILQLLACSEVVSMTVSFLRRKAIDQAQARLYSALSRSPADPRVVTLEVVTATETWQICPARRTNRSNPGGRMRIELEHCICTNTILSAASPLPTYDHEFQVSLVSCVTDSSLRFRSESSNGMHRATCQSKGPLFRYSTSGMEHGACGEVWVGRLGNFLLLRPRHSSHWAFIFSAVGRSPSSTCSRRRDGPAINRHIVRVVLRLEPLGTHLVGGGHVCWMELESI